MLNDWPPSAMRARDRREGGQRLLKVDTGRKRDQLSLRGVTSILPPMVTHATGGF